MVSLASFHYTIIRVMADGHHVDKDYIGHGNMMTTMIMLSLKTMTITKEHLDSLPPQEEAPAEGAEELKFCSFLKFFSQA